jgi:hypothetical protein
MIVITPTFYRLNLIFCKGDFIFNKKSYETICTIQFAVIVVK